MGERWLRWYDGTIRDGKMMLVARECEEAVATVVGIWASLLEDAATSEPRGTATRGLKHHSMWLGLSDQIIGTVWNALERVGAITIDGGQICITNWDKRQYETDDKDPTSKARKDKWKQKHKANGTPRNAAERSGTPETETETETETDIKKDISIKNGWPKDYRERFWQAYPRKVGKGAAIRKLEAIGKSGEIPFDRLLNSISKIEASDPKFIPHPLTWLNQGRYFDAQSTGPPVPFTPSLKDGLPTAEELEAKYGKTRDATGNAEKPEAKTETILDGGIQFRGTKPNGMGVD